MTASLVPDVDLVLERARAHLSPAVAFAQQLNGGRACEVRAHGSEVELSDGRVMLDFGSYAVNLLGHRHPAVVEAVVASLGTMPTSTRVLLNAGPPALAAALVDRVGGSDRRRVWFGTDGSDAVELALKLARVGSGRPRVLAVRGAFHGKTMGALGVTWDSRYRPEPIDSLLAPTTFLASDDVEGVAREAAADDVAAVIVEPVQGENGIVPLDGAVLRRWRDDAARHGVAFLSDEIQCGLRRCGPWSIAVEDGLDPDAVLFGKALGGGVAPISAVIMRDGLYAPLRREPFLHTLTFGGHPLATAAAQATIRVLDGAAGAVVDVGAAMADALADLQRRHAEAIADIRGRGLLWGIAFASPALAGEVLAELTGHGLVTSPCLGAPEVLRLLPPVVVTPDQVAAAHRALDAALSTATATVDHP